MKITHVNTYDISGGAARSAYRLHRGLLELGHDSRMFVAAKASSDPSVKKFEPSRKPWMRLLRALRRRLQMLSQTAIASRPYGATYFSDDRSIHRAGDIIPQMGRSDILHLHWIAWLLDYADFFSQVAGEQPMVWTLHDMNPFTGGCHFDLGCGKFSARCGACPQIESNVETDLSRQIWERKERAFSKVPASAMQLVAPSRWMADEAARSKLLGKFAVTVIPYGIDTHKFQPREQRAARERHGVSADAKVVLFIADWASEKRKGLHLLFEALRQVKDVAGVRFLMIGKGVSPEEIGAKATVLDYQEDEEALSWIYSAADVFVVPSLQDNLPNTALEAMACGTPTVSFAVGGLREIVRENETGLLVEPGSVAGLAAAIKELLQRGKSTMTMRQASRRIAVSEYTIGLQARRYAELYESLLRK